MQEVFQPVLETETRQIESLRLLNVFTKCPGSGENINLDFADETVKWIKERAIAQDRKEAKTQLQFLEWEQLAKKVRDERVHCRFCGEERVWG